MRREKNIRSISSFVLTWRNLILKKSLKIEHFKKQESFEFEIEQRCTVFSKECSTIYPILKSKVLEYSQFFCFIL